jgi:hypothetical protein
MPYTLRAPIDCWTKAGFHLSSSSSWTPNPHLSMPCTSSLLATLEAPSQAGSGGHRRLTGCARAVGLAATSLNHGGQSSASTGNLPRCNHGPTSRTCSHAYKAMTRRYVGPSVGEQVDISVGHDVTIAE